MVFNIVSYMRIHYHTRQCETSGSSTQWNIDEVHFGCGVHSLVVPLVIFYWINEVGEVSQGFLTEISDQYCMGSRTIISNSLNN